MEYPWFALHKWAPFHIDALGLVTFLGSEEVNLYIGRLVPSRWLEYMPFLGAFVIAGDRFKEKKPSFNIYNISSGLNTSDLSCWFTRWMLAQDLNVSRSVVYWEIMENPREWWPYHLIAGAISFCCMGTLIAMTVLSRDWYGFANAVAMAFSIIVRAYILQANRNAITNAIHNAKPLLGTREHALKEWEDRSRSRQPVGPMPDAVNRPNGKPWKPQIAKTMIVMSDSKAVTMFIPEQLIIPVFVNNPEPQDELLYTTFRWVGWAAFTVHIITIGLAQLAAQMYTVALLVIPTVLICWKVGCDDSRRYRRLRSPGDMEAPYDCWIGSTLKATIFEWPKDVEFKKSESGNPEWRLQTPTDDEQRSTRRQDLYAWLDLTGDEEDSMGKWDLLPHQRHDDDDWTKDFNAKKRLIRKRNVDIRATKNAVTRGIERRRLSTWLCGVKQNLDDDVEPSSQATLQPGDPLGPTTSQREETRLSPGGIPSSSTPTPLQHLDHQ